MRGRDLVSGLPKTIVISAEEVRHAIEEPVRAVVDTVKTTLDKCPPELAGDIIDRGIALTGGGELLRGSGPRPQPGAGRGRDLLVAGLQLADHGGELGDVGLFPG